MYLNDIFSFSTHWAQNDHIYHIRNYVYYYKAQRYSRDVYYECERLSGRGQIVLTYAIIDVNELQKLKLYQLVFYKYTFIWHV